MNKVILHAASLLVLGVSLPLHAEEKAQPPTAPFFNHAPEHATWRVIYAPKQAPAPTSAPASAAAPVPPPLTLVEVDVTKMGSIRQDVSLWSDKQTTELWNYDGLCMFTQHGTPDIYSVPLSDSNPNPSALTPDNSKSDFPELDWVNAGNYKSVVTYQQHSCYLFQAKPTGVLVSGYTADQISVQQAWIDVKTKLPVAFDDGLKSVRTYTDLKEIPPRELVLPDKFAKELDDWMKSWRITYGRPWKP